MKTKLLKNWFLLTLLVSSTLFFCTGCDKTDNDQLQKIDFEIDDDYYRGPLTVHVKVDRNTISLAETLTLELQTQIAQNYNLEPPDMSGLLQNFGILDGKTLPDKLDENNSVIKTSRYRLEPFLLGTHQIPSLIFIFYDANQPDAKANSLVTEPIEIEVISLLGDQRENLAIEDIEDVVEMPSGFVFWPIAVAMSTMAIAAICYYIYNRRKQAAELARIYKTAHEIAYELLDQLEKEDLITQQRIKEFYERISNILRHYIEDRFDLRAPERTTEEFLIELTTTDVLAETDKNNLANFLRHCDLVKFAKLIPTDEQSKQTIALVKVFIKKTRSEEFLIDVTDEMKLGAA